MLKIAFKITNIDFLLNDIQKKEWITLHCRK